MSASAAESKWQSLIAERVVALGFASLPEFVTSRPRASLLALTTTLIGPAPNPQDANVSLSALQGMLLGQALDRGSVEHTSRDLLVRMLHQRLDGWPWLADRVGMQRVAGCLFGWAAGIGARLPDYRRPAITLALALLENPLPAGWMPQDADDPLLVAMFLHHWVEPSVA